MTHESTFQGHVIDDLEGVGAFVFNVHGHGMQKAGLPDLQIYSPIWTGHLELKVEKRSVEDLQRIQMRRLNERGTAAFVLRLVGDDVQIEDSDGGLQVTLTDWYVDRDKRQRAKVLMSELAELSVSIWPKNPAWKAAISDQRSEH